jgi:hypothetical protein
MVGFLGYRGTPANRTAIFFRTRFLTYWGYRTPLKNCVFSFARSHHPEAGDSTPNLWQYVGWCGSSTSVSIGVPIGIFGVPSVGSVSVPILVRYMSLALLRPTS